MPEPKEVAVRRPGVRAKASSSCCINSQSLVHRVGLVRGISSILAREQQVLFRNFFSERF